MMIYLKDHISKYLIRDPLFIVTIPRPSKLISVSSSNTALLPGICILLSYPINPTIPAGAELYQPFPPSHMILSFQHMPSAFNHFHTHSRSNNTIRSLKSSATKTFGIQVGCPNPENAQLLCIQCRVGFAPTFLSGMPRQTVRAQVCGMITNIFPFEEYIS
jgi:hypothetical protein